MPNWLASMEQTFEYYIVDPNTWTDIELLTNAKKSTITRDEEVETLGSATIDITESVGECYIRIYLVTIQNGIREKHPLGTYLVQTPSSSFDGRVRNVSMDAYTPLLELKETQPALGYTILKGENIMTSAYNSIRGKTRAPIVRTDCKTNLFYDFVADPSDTWLSYTQDLIANAKYKFDLDAMGNILFAPKQDVAALQPVWTYNDDNSSILYPELTMDHDLYGIPNVVEVIYSNGNKSYHTRVVNDDPTSPTSTVNRGREILYRVTDPDFVSDPSATTTAGRKQIDEYAENLLKELSSLDYTITYTHGYCPVRVGDCVRLNYERAGLIDIKAKVISQTIKCEPGCPVTEKAVFTTKLWEG